MANTTEKVIKTIIIIRNDTEENLIANGDDLILRRGEMCWTISDDTSVPSKLKVGNGISNWNELSYIDFGSNGGTTPGDNLTADNIALQIKNNVISLIGADDSSNIGKSFRISEDGKAIEWFIPADGTKVDANTTLIDQINKALTNNYYTKEETDGLVAKVFRFKGTKNSKKELEDIANPEVGDVWVVKESGASEGNLYVYAEDEDGNGYWEDFPLTVDLSDYVLVTDFNDLKDKVDTIENDVETLKTTVESHTTILDTLKDSTKDLETRVEALEKKNPGDGSGEGCNCDPEAFEELKEKVDGLDEYVESVKPTIDTLPDTIFSGMEVQTLENGDMRIIGVHVNKDTDGKYNIGGESILGTLEAVTPNGKPGLMTGEDKAKLDKLFDIADQGGEPNIIETIKVGGKALDVNTVDKSVNIPIGGEELGVVKNYVEEEDEEEVPVNLVHINDDGTMQVPEVNIDTLVSTGDFVLDGGTAGA